MRRRFRSTPLDRDYLMNSNNQYYDLKVYLCNMLCSDTLVAQNRDINA
ncbi:hypothetical protein RQM65_10490 [Pricia sp. S334]|uniref:Uncharacterized protein n=1 Tax=Pricia mediterranea TaxID=3076079 RepID=A0ABU3L7P9_9FLAO|nr:hypothetical protein [Pricia sp. S334]MDT7829092.1 hypothetical protein [Pricia sp. S334]